MESSILTIGIVALLLGLCVYFFGLPLIILKTHWQDANPKLRQINPEEDPLPLLIQEYFASIEGELSEAGFAEEGTLLLQQQVENVQAVLRVYVNRTTHEGLMAAAIFGMGENGIVQHMQYSQFSTWYADGQMFNTGNAGLVNSFPPRPNVSGLRVPWIREADRLYEIHQKFTSLKGPAAPRELLLDSKYDGNVAAFVASTMREELEEACRAGYLRLVPLVGQYRATVKGAYMMTWKQLPPINKFVDARQRSRTKQLLSELDIC
jgi:hypothetical protein